MGWVLGRWKGGVAADTRVAVCVCVQEVPEELWEVQELHKLNLSLNSLKVLQPGLTMLSNLVVLNLWGNQVPVRTH